MKRNILLMLVIMSLSLCACGNQNDTEYEQSPTALSNEQLDTQVQSEVYPQEKSCTISGSFTVSVREVIPDYCLDDSTPNVAVVTEFQSYPFTMFVGEEIGKKLIEKQIECNIYVFTIEPIEVNWSKEDVQNMNLSSIMWEFPIRITDCRLANENEYGLDSLCLTIE